MQQGASDHPAGGSPGPQGPCPGIPSSHCAAYRDRHRMPSAQWRHRDPPPSQAGHGPKSRARAAVHWRVTGRGEASVLSFVTAYPTLLNAYDPVRTLVSPGLAHGPARHTFDDAGCASIIVIIPSRLCTGEDAGSAEPDPSPG